MQFKNYHEPELLQSDLESDIWGQSWLLQCYWLETCSRRTSYCTGLLQICDL